MKGDFSDGNYYKRFFKIPFLACECEELLKSLQNNDALLHKSFYPSNLPFSDFIWPDFMQGLCLLSFSNRRFSWIEYDPRTGIRDSGNSKTTDVSWITFAVLESIVVFNEGFFFKKKKNVNNRKVEEEFTFEIRRNGFQKIVTSLNYQLFNSSSLVLNFVEERLIQTQLKVFSLKATPTTRTFYLFTILMPTFSFKSLISCHKFNLSIINKNE